MLAQFARPEGSWQCNVCLTWISKGGAYECLSCDAPRKGYEAQRKEAQQQKASNGSPGGKADTLMSFGGSSSSGGLKLGDSSSSGQLARSDLGEVVVRRSGTRARPHWLAACAAPPRRPLLRHDRRLR